MLNCRKQKWYRIIFSVLVCVVATVALADSRPELRGEIDWPTQWTVFAPLGLHDELAEPSQLLQVPDSLRLIDRTGGTIDKREVAGRRIEVTPGRVVDLVEFFGRQQPKNVAYVFMEMDSPQQQVITIGFGADWWLQGWMNGEEVLNTTDSNGNVAFPISMTNHTVDVPLREGRNVFALRFMTGSGTSTLALGGPAEYTAAKRRLERQMARDLNTFQENFEDRLIFPVDVQATIMAEHDIVLPETDADLSAGALAGVQAMPERQIIGRRDFINPRFNEPVQIRLGKERVPAEDRHLDVIVWLSPADEDADVTGNVEVVLKSADGSTLARNTINNLPQSGLFFSVGITPQLVGADGLLEVIWNGDGAEPAHAIAEFSVAPATGVATSGRVPLSILNEPGAVISGLPITVGVPFPRGALSDPANVRLVDKDGREQPLQVKETGRWSRFGPVKWLLCDFTVDLNGRPLQWFLEYGPNVRRSTQPQVEVSERDAGFPDLATGRLRVANGVVAYDFEGNGQYSPLLSTTALTGGFVRHEELGLFTTPHDVAHSVEQIGPEKVIIRRTGWYVNPDTSERFCQFVTRLVFFRDSPVVRIFHTWIYTGDSNRDRVADMGWLFETAQPGTDGEILTAFDEGQWLRQPSLVQFDYQQYLLPGNQSEHDGRTSGVATLRVGDGRVTFGVKDFWQNFPAELAFEEDGLAFYNWPKRNPPARFERPVQVDQAFLLRFAHEGEVLDFRMPDEYAEHDIWASVTRGVDKGPEWQGMHYLEGRPDMVNAQGISRTEEMFLYLTPATTKPAAAAKVMQGLNDETLRAIVAPEWMTGSGVFGPVHPHDTERFAEEERVYDLNASAPPKWTERLGTYGKWIYGDYPTWHLDLVNARINNYRAYHKMAHNYPLRSIPFIRTGNPKYLKIAENAARQLTDVSFNHYTSKDVADSIELPHYRQQGWMGSMSIFPWWVAHGPRNRGIVVDSDFLWDNYYLTGYGRSRDVALLFGELAKQDPMSIPTTRFSQSSLKSFLDMYEATFDPWFLNSAHQIANTHIQAFGGDHTIDPLSAKNPLYTSGYDHWREADQVFYAYSGREDFRSIAVNSAIAHSSPRSGVRSAGPSADGGGNARHAWYAYQYTQDPFYLQLAAASLDQLRYGSWEGDIDYFQGMYTSTHATAIPHISRNVPRAMAMLAQLESEPEPLHIPIWLPRIFPSDDFPKAYIRHDGDGPLRILLNGRGGGAYPCHVRIEGPDGVVVDREMVTTDEPIELDLPAGTYSIAVSGEFTGLFYPLSFPGVPEVVEFATTEDGTATRGGQLGYWFMVPEGVRQFRVRFTATPRSRWPVLRAIVWGPDGERVWDQHRTRADLPVEAVIDVPEGQDGKVWRVTGGTVVMGPQIPPYFSLSQSEWFNPEQ